jgi:hypothetical protein
VEETSTQAQMSSPEMRDKLTGPKQQQEAEQQHKATHWNV